MLGEMLSLSGPLAPERHGVTMCATAEALGTAPDPRPQAELLLPVRATWGKLLSPSEPQFSCLWVGSLENENWTSYRNSGNREDKECWFPAFV